MEDSRDQHSTAQHNKLKRVLLIGYVIGLHLLVVVLIFKTDFISKVKSKLASDSAVSNPHGQRMMVYHRAMDASVPDGAVIFLGDSITQGLATAAVAPNSVNYGIGSETTSELLANIPDYQSLHRASAIFLMIGINDIGQGKMNGLSDRLRTISSEIPKEKPLIWSGIMPAYSEKIDPAQIASANQTIKDSCSKRVSCIYVDSGAIYSSGGATLFRDGVHPNNSGYSKWIAALRVAYNEVPK